MSLPFYLISLFIAFPYLLHIIGKTRRVLFHRLVRFSFPSPFPISSYLPWEKDTKLLPFLYPLVSSSLTQFASSKAYSLRCNLCTSSGNLAAWRRRRWRHTADCVTQWSATRGSPALYLRPVSVLISAQLLLPDQKSGFLESFCGSARTIWFSSQHEVCEFWDYRRGTLRIPFFWGTKLPQQVIKSRCNRSMFKSK